MKKNIILLSLTILMFSCVDKEKTLDNGVEIKYLKTGSASQIQEGENMYMYVHTAPQYDKKCVKFTQGLDCS